MATCVRMREVKATSYQSSWRALRRRSSQTLIEVIMKLRTFAPGAVVSLVTILLVSPKHPQQGRAPLPANGIVLDTYTPDPCSPNGQRHGGCSNPKRLPIRVIPVA